MEEKYYTVEPNTDDTHVVVGPMKLEQAYKYQADNRSKTVKIMKEVKVYVSERD